MRAHLGLWSRVQSEARQGVCFSPPTFSRQGAASEESGLHGVEKTKLEKGTQCEGVSKGVVTMMDGGWARWWEQCVPEGVGTGRGP